MANSDLGYFVPNQFEPYFIQPSSIRTFFIGHFGPFFIGRFGPGQAFSVVSSDLIQRSIRIFSIGQFGPFP